ncbi:MAG TPA: FAD-dependent oxidoreductase [Holophagaceae bacterium]|nr:FAD-dependent oxidoreductase [Holophagaceae bacterium]
MLDALVLGGGIAGLAAARRLRHAGRSVEVWESEAQPGGWARSEPWGDGTLDLGAQVLFRMPGSALDRLLRDTGLPVETVPPRRWVVSSGVPIEVPSHTGQWLRSPLLGPGAKLRVAWGLMKKPGPASAAHLEAAARHRFGRAFARDLLPALAAGLFAAPPARLDGALLPMLMGRAQGGSLVRPLGGMGRLPAALARELPVRTGLRALDLTQDADGLWTVSGGGVSRRTRRVILALPAPVAALMLEPHAHAAAEGLRRIRFLDLRFFHSRHRLPGTLAGGWGLLADPAREGGLLGFTLGPGPGGGAQLRTSLGGAYAVEAGLSRWPGVQARLQGWFPALAAAEDFRETRASLSLPLPEPGHATRVRAILDALPTGISWIGAGRYGGGIPGILGGVEAEPSLG